LQRSRRVAIVPKAIALTVAFAAAALNVAERELWQNYNTR
jgi:hypothetical protein